MSQLVTAAVPHRGINEPIMLHYADGANAAIRRVNDTGAWFVSVERADRSLGFDSVRGTLDAAGRRAAQMVDHERV